VVLTVFRLLLGGIDIRPRAGPLPLLYPFGSNGLVSVARSGLSHSTSWILFVNHDASHPTRTIPCGLTHSRPAERSFVRLLSGIGISFALLNANDMPKG